MQQKQKMGLGFYLAVIVVVILAFVWIRGSWFSPAERTYQEFQEFVESGNVTGAVIQPNKEVPTGSVTLSFSSGTSDLTWNIDNVTETRDYLVEQNIPVTMERVPEEDTFFSIVLPILVGMLIVAMLVMMMINRSLSGGGGGGNQRMMNFGRSRAKVSRDGHGINFKKVAGLEEEKEELAEIVDFLKNPGKYMKVGARIPKGVLLVGPPGTGKTLLAKAVAGEAGVPFFSISGSDFVEMFVGVGASRVRDLFEDAKRSSPCIVFIDEIDAVARRRGTGLGGGHDEREQTLNQLLVEMDGFGANEGIIVMAATNRVDILDPAILRPGRFDRKVAVGRPDVKGREEILQVHAKDKPLSEDVDLKRIAQRT